MAMSGPIYIGDVSHRQTFIWGQHLSRVDVMRWTALSLNKQSDRVAPLYKDQWPD